MGELSIIEWTHSTLNFWRGCDKVDPTCAACYMFRDQRRYGRDPSVVVRCSPSTFYAPLRSRKWAQTRDRHLAELGYHLVFVCSWSDFFHENADPWRADAWDVIRQTPESTYQILTSRPERILEHLPPDWGDDGWPHVWMGVTIGNRRFVDRADLLRQVPAAVRFISAEPLLGPLLRVAEPCEHCGDGEACGMCNWGGWPDGADFDGNELDLTGIDWLIAGGESGGRPGRRLVDEHNQPREDRIGWVRDLRDATRCWRCAGTGWLCAYSGQPATGACCGHPSGCPSCDGCPECYVPGGCGGRGYLTAFLFKQWGGATPKSGGRELDGRMWDELPVGRARELVG